MKTQIIHRYELDAAATRAFFGELLSTPGARVRSVHLEWNSASGNPSMVVEIIEGETAAE